MWEDTTQPSLAFNGDTFVAFLDISGFRKLVKKPRKASNALSIFFNSGYHFIKKHEELNGLFASDSGVIFVNEEGLDNDKKSLDVLLGVVKEINKDVLDQGFILTTSIAYGYFEYTEKLEFKRIKKTHFLGNAYIDAFLDNESNENKINPGNCRILRKNLPENIKEYLDDKNNLDGIYKYLKRSNNHYYFYWMVKDHPDINDFIKRYTDAYEMRYELIKKVLKGE